MSNSVIVSREVTDEIVGRLTGISPSYYRLTGNIRDLNIITANAQKKWNALLAIAKSQTIDPRWADIDFDKVNAELRDLRAQVGRLQAHIDRTQPVVANLGGYVEPLNCTCPSGDGSLRWPCPQHPPEQEFNDDCIPNHTCNGHMVHLPIGEQCDKCGGPNA